jgi:hypothetical protein
MLRLDEKLDSLTQEETEKRRQHVISELWRPLLREAEKNPLEAGHYATHPLHMFYRSRIPGEEGTRYRIIGYFEGPEKKLYAHLLSASVPDSVFYIQGGRPLEELQAIPYWSKKDFKFFKDSCPKPGLFVDPCAGTALAASLPPELFKKLELQPAEIAKEKEEAEKKGTLKEV